LTVIKNRTLGLPGRKFRRHVHLAGPRFETSAAGRAKGPATAADPEGDRHEKDRSGLFIWLDGVIGDAGRWFSLQLGQAAGSVIAAPLTVLNSA
jgi:hypothetical protein